MIKIDLTKLKELNLTINDYLTIFKIQALSKDSDIPYTSYHTTINDLVELGYVSIEDKDIKLTDKALDLINSGDDIDEVLTYFKTVTGKRKIDTSSVSNRRFVRDRLKQGYSVDDLKAVIDLKHKEWNGSSMAKFIRIETLFNQTKFQKYIDELESINNEPEQTDNFRRI